MLHDRPLRVVELEVQVLPRSIDISPQHFPLAMESEPTDPVLAPHPLAKAVSGARF